MRRRSDVDLAAVIEAAHPELAERLSSFVQLNAPDIPDAWRGSVVMRERLFEETTAVSSQIRFDDVVSARASLRSAVIGLTAVFIVLSPILIEGDGYRLLLARHFVPWQNWESAGDLYFEVTKGDRAVARDSPLQLAATLKPRSGNPPPTHAQIVLTDAAEPSETRELMFDENTKAFTIRLPRVERGFEYSFTSENVRSRTYRVNVGDPPTITSFSLAIQPPAYSGHPARSLDGAIGEIEVFENSQLRMQLQFDEVVTEAKLLQGKRDEISVMFGDIDAQSEKIEDRIMQLADDGRSATLEFNLERGGPFAVLLTDKLGLHNRQTAERDFRIVRDAAPDIIEDISDEPLRLSPSTPLVVAATAVDDIAVERFQLECQLPSGETRTVEAPSELLGNRDLTHKFQLRLESFELEPGTALTYRLRAADGRPEPGSQWTETQTRIVMIEPDAPRESERLLADAQQRLLREFDEIQNRVRRQAAQVNQQAKNLEGEKQAEELSAMAGEQTELSQQLRRFSEELSERPVLSSLSSPLKKIAAEQIEPSSQSVAQAAAAEPSERGNFLASSSDRLGEADERLADIRRRFEQLAALERDLLDLEQLAELSQELSQQAAALERRQAELAEQADSPEKAAQQQALAEQQAQVKQDAEKVAEQLKEMMEKHPEIVEAARQEKLKQLKQLGRTAGILAERQLEISGEIRSTTETAVDSKTSDVITQDEVAENKLLNEVVSIAAEQRSLAREVIQLARRIARERGVKSPEAQQALSLAGHVDKAAEKAALGQISTAAQSARQAAEIAAQLTTEFGEKSLAKSTEEFSRRQIELAKKLEAMQSDPASRTTAQQFGQQTLAAQTQSLGDHFAKTARALMSEPLNLPQAGEHAQLASQMTEAARKQMQQATEGLKSSHHRLAIQDGEKAAGILTSIAERIAAALTDSKEGESDLPGEAADEITKAMQQLQQAQQQLAGQQPPASQSESSQEEQQSPSENLQSASDSLAEATEQLQPGAANRKQQRQQGRNSKQTGEAGSPGDSAGGGSNSPGANLDDLQADFERLNRRRWGELSGTLRTEILESAAHSPEGDYAPLIKRYFRELARPRSSAKREGRR